MALDWFRKRDREQGERRAEQAREEQRAEVKAAGAAIGELRDNATIEEIRAVALDAVRKVAAAFEAHQAAKRDAAMREQGIRNACLPREANGREREEIMEAIRTAVAQLPPGTPQWKLEPVRDEVLAPIQQAYERKREEERQKKEAEQQRRYEGTGTETQAFGCGE